jgi:hypothetical protein
VLLVAYRRELIGVGGPVVGTVSQPEGNDPANVELSPGYPMEVIPVGYPFGCVIMGPVPEHSEAAAPVVKHDDSHGGRVAQVISLSRRPVGRVGDVAVTQGYAYGTVFTLAWVLNTLMTFAAVFQDTPGEVSFHSMTMSIPLAITSKQRITPTINWVSSTS